MSPPGCLASENTFLRCRVQWSSSQCVVLVSGWAGRTESWACVGRAAATPSCWIFLHPTSAQCLLGFCGAGGRGRGTEHPAVAEYLDSRFCCQSRTAVHESTHQEHTALSFMCLCCGGVAVPRTTKSSTLGTLLCPKGGDPDRIAHNNLQSRTGDRDCVSIWSSGLQIVWLVL